MGLRQGETLHHPANIANSSLVLIHRHTQSLKIVKCHVPAFTRRLRGREPRVLRRRDGGRPAEPEGILQRPQHPLPGAQSRGSLTRPIPGMQAPDRLRSAIHV